MTQDRDREFITALVGSSTRNGLSNLKLSLALIQAASALALEGNNRATATQISFKAAEQYGIETTASFVGQTFSAFGISTAMTHGKSRFILEYDQLEKARQNTAAKCQELITKLESSIAAFKELPERIQSLETQWQDILKNRIRERELIDAINESRKTPSRLNAYEMEWNRIQVEAKKVKELEQECQQLTEKLKALPALEERKLKLNATIYNYNAEVNKIQSQEQDMKRRQEKLVPIINKLIEQKKWVELAELEEAIKTAKKELHELSQQIGEKRTLLDKILGRKKDG